MLPTQPKRLTLTLLSFLALSLLLASTTAEAKGHAAVPIHRREHVNLNRLIKKRAPPAGAKEDVNGGNLAAGNPNGGVIGAGSPPPPVSAAPESAAPASATPVSASPVSDVSKSSALPVSQTSTSNILSDIVNTLSSTSTSSLHLSTSSSLTSSSALPSSSSAALPTSTSTIAPPPTATPPPVQPTTDAGGATVTFTSSAAQQSATQPAVPTSSAGKITRTALTVLIVIAASIGGTAIIWTIIRKWKFKKSSSFEDRMQPIDWAPTNDDAVASHRRASMASSFHSGQNHEENMAGQHGAYGNGNGSQDGHSNYSHGQQSLGPLPEHDFTAAPAQGGLAPVGGYADLARGPSPGPMYRGPSPGPQQMMENHGPAYGVPLHHQGGGYQNQSQDAYDYNGARY